MRARFVAVLCLSAVSARAQDPPKLRLTPPPLPLTQLPGTYIIWECGKTCSFDDTATAPLTGILVLNPTPLVEEQFPVRFRRHLHMSSMFMFPPGEGANLNACVNITSKTSTQKFVGRNYYALTSWVMSRDSVSVRLYQSPDASWTLTAPVGLSLLDGRERRSLFPASLQEDDATRVLGKRIGDADILKCLPALLPADTANEALTAAQLVSRIQKRAGVVLPQKTADSFKAGDPAMVVKGVAVTMMATLDVLQRAASRGANLIITHEPTFYTHLDTVRALTREGDATLAAKKAFIEQRGLVIFRFHDAPHAMKPDMINTGIARELGWEKNTYNDNPVVFDIQPTTLAALANYVSGKLGAKATRIAGDPNAQISRVVFTQGFVGFTTNRHAFQNNNVDAIIIGEDHEWETIEYAVDAIAAGKLKGLIVIGHIPSEQAGMEEVTRWLKTFITEVPIEFIPTGDLLTRAPQTSPAR